MNWQNPILRDFLFSEDVLRSLHVPILEPVLGPLTVLFHYLGTYFFFMAIVSAIYICVDRKVGMRLAIGLMISGILNGACKAYFGYPRPSDLPYSGFLGVSESSFGFPSGHVQTSVVLYGTMLIHFRATLVKVICAFILAYMPFARMYAGLHYLGDVLGGAVLGAILLFGIEVWFRKDPSLLEPSFLGGVEVSRKRIRSYSLLWIAATIPSILLIEESHSEGPTLKSLEQVVSSAGSLAGFGIGVLFLKKNEFDWHRTSSPYSNLVRIATVALGIFLFYFVLGQIVKSLFPENQVARYLRYAIVCFYISYLSPLVLKRMNGGIHLQ
ncbi:acid phosphatase [Leptospira perolatii]|uniref:Acid phosphatase n=1 Tax=Leptospira perolatii TaxID=2023191 RepID=A0A2M9ZPU3_9LEPT|nr:phosphatase PAP2 family protein [Leptospira perolatii]PJZ69045.1 acid phosphatase [Leptospira perolatii]PJZ74086.1 acid phosphatase [Leptospira perolatii]